MPQGVPISSVSSIETRAFKWRWWALIGASLAVFMAALDNNVVNVALPIMARMFHVDRGIRWVVLSYVLPTTALLGAFGALSDVIGRRRITLIGIALFLAGSVLCGTARSLPQMVVYRVIQGIGSSAIGSAILAIATVSFAPGERGRAMAVVGLIVPLGAVVGPSLGGLLIGAFGWPAIFFINVPFGIVAFTLIFRLLPRDERKEVKAFDFPGAILISAALFLLVIGLSPTNGRLSEVNVMMLAGSAASIAGLILVEQRAASPLVPPSLVRRRHFSIPITGIMTMGIVGAGLGFVLPFFLESVQGLSPERSGLTLLFFPLAMAAASQVGGRLSDRFNPRLPALVGGATSLVGVILLVPLNSEWHWAGMAARLAVIGLGFGFFISPSSVAVMAATTRDHVGVGGALVNTSRFLGFALGPVLATVFWSPALAGAVGIAAMRTVILVLAGVQVLSIASVLGYRVGGDTQETREAARSANGTAA